MGKVITFSRQFPSYHPKAGQQTYFVEKIYKSFHNGNGTAPCFHPFIDTYFETLGELPGSGFDDKKAFFHSLDPKIHTIRAGHRFKAGDWFTPKVWGTDINPKSGRSGPYHSKQIQFAPDIQVKKTWDLDIHGTDWYLDGRHEYTTGWSTSKETIAANDGLNFIDFYDWFTMSPDFKKTQDFFGQIICWSDQIEY